MARRYSRQTAAVVEVLLEGHSGEHYGYDLMRRTGLKAGTLYPILRRFEADGLLTRRSEPNPVDGFPARKQYRLNSGAMAVFAQKLSEYRQAEGTELPGDAGWIRA